MSTITNPQQTRSFYKQHMNDQKYIMTYKRLGYTNSDLEEISPLGIQKQSASFLKKLNSRDREFYIKKKYQTLVIRRDKIIKQVNENYNKELKMQSPTNSQILTQSVDRKKYKIFQELSNKQKEFYEKQKRYYSIVKQMKQKKVKQFHQVQQNSYINSQHYKTLVQKRSSSNFSNNTSVRSFRIKQCQQSQKKRSYVKQKFSNLCEQSEKQKQLFLHRKLKKTKQKIQRVYDNLRKLTIYRKQKSQTIQNQIQESKKQIDLMKKQDIQRKKQKIYLQMQKFQQNRKVQLLKRDSKLQNQKKQFEQKQQYVKQKQDSKEKQIQNHAKQLSQKVLKTLKKKQKLDYLRNLEIKDISQIRKQKHLSTINSKQKQYKEKQFKNFHLYQKYNHTLKNVLETKSIKTKQQQTKLLVQQKIKQQIAQKNQQVKQRQSSLKKNQILTKRAAKKSTVQQILNLKDTMIVQRRVFLGKTIKQLQGIDRQFSNRTMMLNSYRRPMTSDLPSTLPNNSNRSVNVRGQTSDSFYRMKKEQSYVYE